MSTITSVRIIDNPRPKARFQLSNENVAKHRDMVDNRAFERGADFAMLEYQAELAQKENNPTVLGLKLVGAQEFLQTFRLLSETAKLTPPIRANDNLQSQ